MSTSYADAVAQLKNFNRCLFAYMDNEHDDKHQYIVLKSDGTITLQEVSGVTQNDTFHGEDGITFVGIALEYVSPFTNVPEVSADLEKSELVTKLRAAMADGKFAPIIQPSSK